MRSRWTNRPNCQPRNKVPVRHRPASPPPSPARGQESAARLLPAHQTRADFLGFLCVRAQQGAIAGIDDSRIPRQLMHSTSAAGVKMSGVAPATRSRAVHSPLVSRRDSASKYRPVIRCASCRRSVRSSNREVQGPADQQTVQQLLERRLFSTSMEGSAPRPSTRYVSALCMRSAGVDSRVDHLSERCRDRLQRFPIPALRKS